MCRRDDKPELLGTNLLLERSFNWNRGESKAIKFNEFVLLLCRKDGMKLSGVGELVPHQSANKNKKVFGGDLL